MAKRRRLNKTPRNEPRSIEPVSPTPLLSGVGGLNPNAIALGLLSGAIVYVMYHPSDSVAVEKGDALWFGLLAILVATIAVTARVWPSRLLNRGVELRSGNGRKEQTRSSGPFRADASVTDGGAAESDVGQPYDELTGNSQSRARILQVASIGLWLAPWMLAAWMMFAAFATSPPGNLRMATNEAWLWISGACIFTSARLLLGPMQARRNIVGLIVICGCGLAVHGLHQYLVSLPQNRAEYRADPDDVLRKAMIDAPAGSAERMVFENRLMDGGPTATFALANSLAAVLLFTVGLALGVLLLAWKELTWTQRLGWLSAASLCAACLMAARSRSATLAMLIAVAMLLVAATRVMERRRKAFAIGMLGLAGAVGLGALFLAMFGNREWFEEAPASLAFRFQYWRSTWQMVLDHSLFGAGPGNFQSIYERYRESSATEQIAEPHNLFVETLASGGFVALALLVFGGLCGLVIWRLRESQLQLAECSALEPASSALERANAARESESGTLGRWVWLGALTSLALIWMLGWISRRPPDLDASLYVLPIAVILGWVLASSVSKIAPRDFDTVIAISIVAVFIHLMISGGWTVPGVAILIWLAAGMLVPDSSALSDQLVTGALPPSSDSAKASTHRHANGVHSNSNAGQKLGEFLSRFPWMAPSAAAVIGAALVAALWFGSLEPVQQRKMWMDRAAFAQAQNQPAVSLRALTAAVDSDRWSPDAVLWLADFYRWRLISEGDSRAVREKWERALDEAKARAGEDPAVFRMVGGQQLHVYQALGKTRDLDSASDSFGAATRWSPSNQWLFAQMAAIEQERGDRESAAQFAGQARFLSEQGGNIERALSRQMIYLPRRSPGATRGPVRVAADELLEGATVSQGATTVKIGSDSATEPKSRPPAESK